MAIPLNINGSVFEYPENFDENWGVNATGWAQAVTNGMLQRQGGNFPLTADANFGASFGLVAAYYTSRTSNPATTGTFRLASADPGVAFRNNANSGNLILTTDSSDNLLYNGHIISPSSAGTVTSITGTANEIIASSATGNITLSTPQAIAPTSSPTFATLTLSSPLSVPNGGTGSTSLTAYAILTGGTSSTSPIQSVASVGLAGQVLTSNGPGVLPSFSNTTGSGTVNSGTANQLAYYATSSATISGLTAITINKALISDSNGLPIASTTTATELGFSSGVTSSIQTQINSTVTVANAALPKSGGTMSGAINMGSNKITSLTNGSSSADAVAYNQLKLLQVLTKTTSTPISTTSSTYVSSNYDLAITLSSSTNKVFIIVTGNVANNDEDRGAVSIFRDGSNLLSAGGGAYIFENVGAGTIDAPFTLTYLDTPGSTGPFTYNVYFKSGAGTTTLLSNSSTGSITLFEIQA